MATTQSTDIKTEPISPPRRKLGPADYGYIGRGKPSSSPRFVPYIQPKIEPKVEPKVEPQVEPKPDPTVPRLAPPIPSLPPAAYPPRTQYTPAQQAQHLQVLMKVYGYSNAQALQQVYGLSNTQTPQQVYGYTQATSSTPQAQVYAATNVQQATPLPSQSTQNTLHPQHTQHSYHAQHNVHQAQHNGNHAQHNHHHTQHNTQQIPLHTQPTQNAHHTQYHQHTQKSTQQAPQQLLPPLQLEQTAHRDMSRDPPVSQAKRARRRGPLLPTTSLSTASTATTDQTDHEMLPSQEHPQTSFYDYENPDQYYPPNAVWEGHCPEFITSLSSAQPSPYTRAWGAPHLGPLPDPAPATSGEEPPRPPTPQHRECPMAFVTGESGYTQLGPVLTPVWCDPVFEQVDGAWGWRCWSCTVWYP